jgi:hypothetical protein
MLLAPPPPGSMLEVSAADGRLTIRTIGTPLADVLQEVARKTGMQVVFETRPPRQLVSANIEGLPEEEAIARLFEGQSVSWAVQLAANRRRIERLVIAEPGVAGRAKQPGQAKPQDVPEPEVPAEASYPPPRRFGPSPTPRPSPTASPRPSPRATPTPSPGPTRRPTPTPTPTPRP